MHSEEIEAIKKQLIDNKEAYEKEKEKWESQKIKIENELNDFKIKEISEFIPNLSYNSLY